MFRLKTALVFTLVATLLRQRREIGRLKREAEQRAEPPEPPAI